MLDTTPIGLRSSSTTMMRWIWASIIIRTRTRIGVAAARGGPHLLEGTAPFGQRADHRLLSSEQLPFDLVGTGRKRDILRVLASLLDPVDEIGRA